MSIDKGTITANGGINVTRNDGAKGGNGGNGSISIGQLLLGRYVDILSPEF